MAASYRRPELALYCANLDELSITGFLLETRMPARVARCAELEQLLGALNANPYAPAGGGIRLAIVIHEGRTPEAKAATEAILRAVDEEFPDVPLLLVDLAKVFNDDALADRRLAGVFSPVVLIGAARQLAARKRGPIQNGRPLPARPLRRPATREERMLTLAERCA